MLVGEVRSRVEAIFEEKPSEDLCLARSLGVPDEGRNEVRLWPWHNGAVSLIDGEDMTLKEEPLIFL